VIREFDADALYAALDAKRQALGLSWPGAAAWIWDMAPALNAARDARGLPNHPISPSTRRRAAPGLWPLPASALGSEGAARSLQ
jgi:hypothetical protein